MLSEFPKTVVKMSEFYKRLDPLEPVLFQVRRAKARKIMPKLYSDLSKSKVTVTPDDWQYPELYAATTKALGCAMDFAQVQRDYFKDLHGDNMYTKKMLVQQASKLPILNRLSWLSKIYSPRMVLHYHNMGKTVNTLERHYDRLAQAYTYLEENKPRRK